MSTTEISERPLQSRALDPEGFKTSAQEQSIWRRIRTDVLLFGAGNAGTVAAQLAFRSLLVVALLPAAYGRLSLVLAVYNTVWIVGASGIPSSLARHIALIAPADDSAIIRSALRAGALPLAVSAAAIAAVSGLIMHSLVAAALGASGLSCLVGSLIAMGILRGRGHAGWAAAIMVTAAIAEVAPLAALWWLGFGITPLSAFAVFCFGNAVGLLAGLLFALRTAPSRRAGHPVSATPAPGARELLSFSVWLGTATAAVTLLPLVVRWAATLDSYTVVAVVDIAIVLLSLPQRVGSVILMAVVPHAARAVQEGRAEVTISRRSYAMLCLPFLVGAAVIAFTPLVGWAFDALGRHVYSQSAPYLALALLVAPARVLYGLIEGMLIAYGDGRFLATSTLSVAGVASILIFVAVALGSVVASFAVFAVAFWAIYLVCLARVNRFASLPAAARRSRSLAPTR